MITRHAVCTIIVVVVQASLTGYKINGILLILLHDQAEVWDGGGADDFTGASGGDEGISGTLNTDPSTGARETISATVWKLETDAEFR